MSSTPMRIDEVPYAGDLLDALAMPHTQAMRVAEDLFALADMVTTDARLRSALTDPSRSPQDKIGLVDALFGEKMTTAALRVLQAMVRGHWAKPEALHDAAEVLGIIAVLTDAQREGALDTVEAELFELRRFLGANRALRLVLSDMSTGTPHERANLATRLFAKTLCAWTMRLLRRAVGRSRHGRLLANLHRFAQWAASIESRLLVTVETSADMSVEQVARLSKALESRFGRPISLAVSIEDDVIGGFRIRAETTSIDASLATRIANMKRALAS